MMKEHVILKRERERDVRDTARKGDGVRNDRPVRLTLAHEVQVLGSSLQQHALEARRQA